MKRVMIPVFSALLLFVLFFFGLNLFDSSPEAGPPAAAATAALAENLEPGNGFFLVWGFAEPPDIDPMAPGYRQEVRRLFAPWRGAPPSRSPYAQWLARLNDANRRHWRGTNFFFPLEADRDIADFFRSRRDLVSEFLQRFAPLLRRYHGLLAAGDLRDFTPLNRAPAGRCLQLVTQVAKPYAAAQVLAALDGAWLEAGANLLRAADAGSRLLASGRTLAVNSLGRSLVEVSLRSLSSLLNRRECPAQLPRLVLERMPDSPVSRFGTAAVRTYTILGFSASISRVKQERIVDPLLLKDYFREPASFFALERFVAISGQGVFFAVHALASFFLKENETVSMLRGFWDGIGRLEETPPWRWGADSAPNLPGPGLAPPLWWLRNPLGKMMARSAVPYGRLMRRNYAQRSHETKVRYDLLRILAQARLLAASGGELDEASLRRLLAAAGRDPFSGAAYRFSRESGTLYSVGADASDDQGRERPGAFRGTDIAVPIRFVKPDS